MSTISNFLTTEGWATRFDTEVIEIGRRLKSKINNITWESMPDGGGVIIGDWSDKGTSYHPEITIWLDGDNWMIETECGCEERFFCVHAAAVLLRASQAHIIDKLMKFGSLMNSGRISAKTEPDMPIEEPEEERLRSAPYFQLKLIRVAKRPEVIETYLKKKRPSRDLSDKQVPLSIATVVYPSAEFGDFVFPLLSEIAEGETRRTLPDGRSLVIERFRALEKDASSQLARCGLMAVASEYAWIARIIEKKPHWVDDAYQCFFPDPTRVEEGQCWLDTRNAGIPLLEQHGWKVEISDDFGYKVEECDPADWEQTSS